MGAWRPVTPSIVIDDHDDHDDHDDDHGVVREDVNGVNHTFLDKV